MKWSKTQLSCFNKITVSGVAKGSAVEGGHFLSSLLMVAVEGFKMTPLIIVACCVFEDMVMMWLNKIMDQHNFTCLINLTNQ